MNIFVATFMLMVSVQLDGNDLLQRIDEQGQRTKSQVLTMEMAIQDPGREPRRVGMQMHMRGDHRRISFLYPGDMKGMRVLTISSAQTYVYLPQFRKVRRIASHAQNQSMFGSDYGFDDFSTLALHSNYLGHIISEDPNTWTVRAIPRDGAEIAYGHIELRVDKKLWMPVELKFFDAKGTCVRTETRDDFQCVDNVCAPRHTKMIDHRHEDHWTEVKIKDLELNTEFSDSIFSLRDLQRND